MRLQQGHDFHERVPFARALLVEAGIVGLLDGGRFLAEGSDDDAVDDELLIVGIGGADDGGCVAAR